MGLFGVGVHCLFVSMLMCLVGSRRPVCVAARQWPVYHTQVKQVGKKAAKEARRQERRLQEAAGLAAPGGGVGVQMVVAAELSYEYGHFERHGRGATARVAASFVLDSNDVAVQVWM